MAQGWLGYVEQHADVLDSRQRLLLAQTLEAAGIIQAASAYGQDPSLGAAARVTTSAAVQRAIEMNTHAVHEITSKQETPK